jgi:pimeloyl-ACP methyl ester carboxylesterase
MALVEFKGFGGVRLQANVIGSPDDPPVLMLHGGGQTRRIWDGAAAALAEAGRQVISLDLRGHGASQWPADGRYDLDAYVEDLRAVLGQLGSRPVIVAASLGGWIATAALGEDGAHFATGLVLADAPPKLNPAVAKGVRKALLRRATQSGAATPWGPRFLDGIDTGAVADRLEALAPNIAVPTLFVRGATSAMTVQGEAEAFVKLISNAEFVEVEEAGHDVAAEGAEIFNALVLDFLESRIPRAAPEYRAGADARTLRDAMGCFATGVTILTTYDGADEPIGLTANSFTSVSLDPALLLVCIAKSSSSLPSFVAAEKFAATAQPRPAARLQPLHPPRREPVRLNPVGGRGVPRASAAG